MTNKHTHKTQTENFCPGCGRKAWSVSTVENGGVERPLPGDPIVCDRCSCIHTVDDDGRFVGFTAQQADELEAYLAANPEPKKLLRETVGIVRLVRAGVIDSGYAEPCT